MLRSVDSLQVRRSGHRRRHVARVDAQRLDGVVVHDVVVDVERTRQRHGERECVRIAVLRRHDDAALARERARGHRDDERVVVPRGDARDGAADRDGARALIAAEVLAGDRHARADDAGRGRDRLDEGRLRRLVLVLAAAAAGREDDHHCGESAERAIHPHNLPTTALLRERAQRLQPFFQ